MSVQFRDSRPCLVALRIGLISAAFTVNAFGGDTIVSLNPKATYLHTNNDPALDAVAIELAGLGLSPGDVVRLEQLGGWDNGPGSDIARHMLGVFSASATLLSASETYRVPDAIDVGVDYESEPTWYGAQVTDITEDFHIANYDVFSQSCVEIPPGATHLFVSGHDNLFFDNSDPNGDWAVRITLLNCPTDIVEPRDGVTNVADLLSLLSEWGQAGADSDVDCDGTVGVTDLLQLLAAWGPCT